MARNEKAKATIYLDGKQAEAALDSIKNKAKEVRREMKAAQEAGDNAKYNKLKKELKSLDSTTRSLRKETFDYQKVLNDLNGSSMRDLKKALRTVEVQLFKMKKTDPGYALKAAQAKKLRAEITRVNAGLRGQNKWLNKVSMGFNKYMGMATVVIATLTGMAFSIKEMISGLVGLDDSLADVMKTTGMTRREVREMYTDFKYLNTRTPRSELLLLAEEAGRLGKKSKKDIEDFVEVANQIKVALGDDLGGEASVAIREVGKLTDIYRVGEQYGTGFKDSMTKVGSAINEVSANSNTQAPYLIDYLKRMGGIAGQMDINASKVIGYASALDQLGQSQEMAATAQGKVMVDMFKDQAKYAQIANMSTADFANLLETDANEAFLKLLEGLNGNNEGFSVMAKKLDDLGIDGARAVQVLSVLSANTKMVREQQDLANTAMDKGTSLTEEYNLKNNNLAGSMAKIGQALRSKFINSGFLGWMEKVVAKTAEWVEVPVQEKIKKESFEVNQLVIEMTNANTTAGRRNEIYTQLNQIAPDVVKNIDLENISVSNLRENLEKYNEAMIKKLALQDTEDNLQDKREAAGKATGTRIEKESQLINEFISIKQQADKMNKDYADNLQEVILSDDDVITKTERINELLEGQRHFYRTNMEVVTNQVVSARQKEKDALDEVNTALDEYSQRYERLFGAGKTGSGGGGNPNGGTDGNPNGGTGGNPNGGTGGGFKYEEATEDPLQVEGWMTSGNWDKYGTEELAAKQASEEEWTEFLSQQIDQRAQAEAKAFKIEEEIAQARVELKDMQVNAIGELASSLAGMFEQGSAAQIAMIAIEKGVAIAQIWMNLAKEKSLINVAAAQMATIPFVGPAMAATYSATMTAKAVAAAKINTGLIVAQTVASSLGSKKAKKSKEMYTGGFAGYTGDGDKYEKKQLVQLHGSEYVIPKEGTENPSLQPFINMIEIARRGGSLRQLNIGPAVISTRKEMASGGAVADSSGANPTQPYTSPQLIKMLDTNNQLMQQLLKTGIKAYVNKYGTNGLQEAMDDISDFKSKVSRK
ncbi:phage tail tape measure protein [Draconibacterium orientale]|uniref:phage tail tape measure protein n=1 Tax=Draconibacterium orientale TaxID=1168034 RepID=UPI0029C04CA9|nr:phage tail tape measure protein [Draconibacterium orientale]